MTYVPGIKIINATSISASAIDVSGNMSVSGNMLFGYLGATGDILQLSGTTTIRCPITGGNNARFNIDGKLNTYDSSTVGVISLPNNNTNFVVKNDAVFRELNIGNYIYTSSIKNITFDGSLITASQIVSTNINTLYFIDSKIIAREESVLVGADLQNEFGNTLYFDQNGYLFIGQTPTGLSNIEGRVYVYRLENKKFSRVSASINSLYLTASNSRADDMFGQCISRENDYMVIGIPYATVTNQTSSGGVAVFKSSSNGWKEEQKILSTSPSIKSTGNTFGWSLAYDNNIIYVGQPYSTGSVESGSVYVYASSSGGWSLRNTITGNFSGDNFGYYVTKKADKLIIGAPYQQDGALYIYNTSSNGLYLEQMLTTSVATIRDFKYGTFFEYSGNYLFVGAAAENNRRGQIYLYNSSSLGWNLVQTITGTDTTINSYFGYRFKLFNNNLLVNSTQKVFYYITSSAGWVKTTASIYVDALERSAVNVYGDTANNYGQSSIEGSGNYLVISDAYQAGRKGTVYPYKYDTSKGWLKFGESKAEMYKVKGLIKNIENNLTILTQSKEVILSEFNSCNASLSVTGTNINLNITGSSPEIINWNAAVEIKKIQSI